MTGVLGTFGFFFGGPDPGEYGIATTAAGGLPRGRTYVTVGGERVDQVAQAAYGFQLGAVEALLLANPGLGDQPILLRANLAIELPELSSSAQATTVEVALFGVEASDQPLSSSSTQRRTYVTVGGERIDQVAQVAYGFQLGAVEALLLANPGLGDQPMQLPADLTIELPALASGSVQTVTRESLLWG